MEYQTLGHLLFADAIPEQYRPRGAYTKGVLQKNMTRFAKEDPDAYAESIVKVKNLGDQFATLQGISVGLDDIAPIYNARNAITQPALDRIKGKTRAQRQEIVGQTQERLLDYTKTHPGTMGDMARSGGRGNMVQLMKAVGSPVAANDEKDQVQPWLITRSYSEGLRPSEYWVANREARMAAVKSNIEVTEPGDLSKIISNNTAAAVITMRDCGTHNGLRFAVTDPTCQDRYLAHAEKGVAANTLLTARILGELRKEGSGMLTVRSPMTCEAPTGICQMCQGVTVTGKMNAIGDNVGIRASHALGEPLTQLALNAKHGVRTAGGSAGVSGLTGFRAILESPMSFKNKATLAPKNGTVESVTAAAQGGHYVTISGERVHTAPGLGVAVAVGDHVLAGDALSEGVPRPDEVVQHKGLGAGRDYLVEKLQGIYKDSGIDVDRRHFEILAKSNLNHMKVDHIEPNDHGVVRGDTIDYNMFRRIVGESVEEVPLSQAEGKYLAKGAHQHLPGTLVSANVVRDLRNAGVQKVTVATVAPRVTPIMAAATRNPLLNPDYLVRAGHRFLKNTFVEGAAMGHTSDIHGASPIPAIIYGSEFGEGPNGHY